MLYNILASTADKFRRPGLDEGAIYAILGFIIVFIGIALLILIVWAVGKIMSVTQNKGKAKTKRKAFIKTAPDMDESLAIADATKGSDEALSEETVAVITAAIMAYYQQNNPKCEFTVKRIKRI